MPDRDRRPAQPRQEPPPLPERRWTGLHTLVVAGLACWVALLWLVTTLVEP